MPGRSSSSPSSIPKPLFRTVGVLTMDCWIVLSVLLQAVYVISALSSTAVTENPSTSVPQDSTSLSSTWSSITSSATSDTSVTTSLPQTSSTPNSTIEPTAPVTANLTTAQISTQQTVWSSMVTSNYSMPADNSSASPGALNGGSQSSNNLALVLGLAIGLGGAALIVLIVLAAVGVKKWRFQRSQHGVYNPSKQETIGGIDYLHAADAQLSAILKVPPEERLI